MLRRTVLTATAALVVCLMITAASAARTEQRAMDSRFASATWPSLTGNFSASGPAFAKGAGLAVREAQTALRRAGIRDIKIQIEHADDELDSHRRRRAARKLLQNGADCLIGALSSGSTIAMAEERPCRLERR